MAALGWMADVSLRIAFVPSLIFICSNRLVNSQNIKT